MAAVYIIYEIMHSWFKKCQNTLGLKSVKRRKFSSTTLVSLSKTVPLMDSLYWCTEKNSLELMHSI